MDAKKKRPKEASLGENASLEPKKATAPITVICLLDYKPRSEVWKLQQNRW